MPEEQQAESEMLTLNDLMKKLTRTDVGKAGLALSLIGLIGLIVVFSVPWFEMEYMGWDWDDGEPEEEEKSIKYDDLEDYPLDSARMSLLGFAGVLIGGVLLSLQAFNGKVYDALSPNLSPEFRSNPDHTEFLKTMFVMILMLSTLLVIISGTRFIGFAESFEESEMVDSMTTTAGWTVLILGILLFVLEMAYLVPRIHSKMTSDRNRYRQRLSNYASLMTLFCTIGLIFFSALPVMTMDVEDEDEERTIRLNDGFIHDFAESSEEDKVSSDLGWMSFLLWVGLFAGFIALLGLMYSNYLEDDSSGKFHFMTALGSLAFVAGVLFIVFQVMLFSHINDMDEEDEDEDSKMDASFGWNYIPLICAMGLVGIGALYTKEAYPVSIQRVLGMKQPSPDGLPRGGRLSRLRPADPCLQGGSYQVSRLRSDFHGGRNGPIHPGRRVRKS